MARDENDRPYEDGQGRPLNPGLTGDVLSGPERWSTEDTDEQPAIQVVGNETYILPLDKGSPANEPPRDVFDEPAPRGLLAPDPRDVLGAAHNHDVPVAGDPHDALGDSYDPLTGSAYDLGGPSGAHDVAHDRTHDADGAPGGAYDPADDYSGPHRLEGDSSPYLPLDRGYDLDDGDEDRPRRGFLCSGWTDDSKDPFDGPSEGGEVRRRTRVLLVAAIAVVLVGVGAGWMLTGTSSDDPCAGGRCASAGEVTSPTDSPLPEEETPVEDDSEDTTSESPESDEPTDDVTDSVADDPGDSEAVIPTHAQPRVRQPEPSERTTPKQVDKPTQKATKRPTREPQSSVNETGDDGRDTTGDTDDKPATKRPQSRPETTQAPSGSSDTDSSSQETQAPAPTPLQEEDSGGGLLDILFPWA